ncbi:MAG TPA: hypothetical protein VGH24_06545, partial [Solirubrobacteraceae bacterium]
MNSRLAPDIYLGVHGLAEVRGQLELVDEADTRAIDYMVEMERFDESRTLAAALDRGECSRADVVAVARTLARFHADCGVVPLPSDPVRTVQREVDVNFAELLPLVELRGERERELALWRFQSAFVAAHGSLLDARARAGLIRDCHGDLRAEHVLLGDLAEVIECRAPAHVLAERAIARDRGERHASDAGLVVVLSERTSWEPLDEVRPQA